METKFGDDGDVTSQRDGGIDAKGQEMYRLRLRIAIRLALED